MLSETIGGEIPLIYNYVIDMTEMNNMPETAQTGDNKEKDIDDLVFSGDWSEISYMLFDRDKALLQMIKDLKQEIEKLKQKGGGDVSPSSSSPFKGVVTAGLRQMYEYVKFKNMTVEEIMKETGTTRQNICERIRHMNKNLKRSVKPRSA